MAHAAERRASGSAPSGQRAGADEERAPGGAHRAAAGDHLAGVGGTLLLLGVALSAANMRPAVTTLASVLGEAQHDLGVGSTWTSVLTSVPTLCFGLAGTAAPLLARRFGLNRVIGASLVVLTAAMVLRVTDGPATVVAGTVLVCVAIAMCNVLIPVVVKESFPHRIGTATAVYTTTMAAGGAVGSGVTPWLESVFGSWRAALAVWAVLALAACCVWIPAAFRQRAAPRSAPDGTAPPGPAGAHRRSSLLRSPLAWAVTGYFAMQSLVAYVVMGWIPEVFRGLGLPPTTAGVLLSVLLLIGVPINMVLPPLVSRSRTQSWWALGLGALSVAGLSGLLLAPLAMPVVWALLLGVGMSAFPLALVLISLRSADAADTSRLSAMAQSVGYCIASCGPFLFGVLHEASGGWTASLLLILAVVLAQTVVGAIAGRPRVV